MKFLNNNNKIFSAIAAILVLTLTPLAAAVTKSTNFSRPNALPQTQKSLSSKLPIKQNFWPSAIDKKTTKAADTKTYSNTQVIVKFKNGSVSKRSSIVDKYDASLSQRIDDTNNFRVKVPTDVKVTNFIKEIEKDPGVAYAEPDYIVKALGQKTSWGYDRVNAEAAHSENTVTGNGVTVAVVDTGVDYLHEDLDANIWSNGGEVAGNSTDDDGNGYIDDIRGWDFIGELGGYSGNPQEDNDPMDGAGHGTHVSGIVAAEDNTIGTVGAAPDATIMPVKVLDDAGFGLNSTVADGIRYATDNGADIINMSLGGFYPSRTLKEAVNYAVNNGVTIAVAAGNAYGFNLFASYPAVYSNVISVGASDKSDQKTWWSNWGKVDVMAPGLNILSSIPEDRYTKYSGTSMATPFVAGTLALIKDAHPGFGGAKLRQVLEANASDLYHINKDYLTGNGLIDAEAATNTLADSFTLTASSFRIIANDNDFTDGTSTIAAQILDENGDAVAGQAVTFTTDRGTITGSPDTTDGSGLATAILTADDTDGLATVTASAGGYGTEKIEVLLFNDKAQIATVRFEADSEYCDEFCGTPDELTGTVKPQAGETVNLEVVLRYVPLLYLDAIDTRTSDLNWELLDGDSNVVDSGSKNDIEVGVRAISSTNVSVPVDLPEDLVDGRYTFSATVTDQDNSKTDSKSLKFNVGGDRNILVVQNPNVPYVSMDPYNVDRLDSLVSAPLEPLLSALNNLVEDYDVWPYGSFPSTTDLERYPVVIVTSADQSTADALYDYLGSGGNAFISGNSDWLSAVNESNNLGGTTGTGSCADTATPFENDYFICAGVNAYPTAVSGIDDNIFDGMSFDIDGYNLAGDSAHNQLYVDEFELKEGAPAALKYNTGINDPAIAGFAADNGTSNLLFTGFGIEGMNNNTGAVNDREDFLGATLDFFRPDSVSVDSVSPTQVDKGTAKRLTISGEGFVGTGKTIVTLGSNRLSNVVVEDRNTLKATVPASYPSTGLKNLTVTNPFGQSDTLNNAVRVRHPAPIISSRTPKFGSNDKGRSLTINGKNFRSGVVVKLGSKTLSPRTLVSSKKIVATVPKGMTPGLYSLFVTNSDGRKDSLNDAYKVRFGFTHNLSLGANETAVLMLERRLASAGYFTLTPNTYFGTATRSALRSYQSAKGLTVTGVLDAATRQYLNNH